jgi:hypothetical protein
MVIQGIEPFMSKLVVTHLLLLLRRACAALFATDTSTSSLPTTTQSSQTMTPHSSNFRNGAYRQLCRYMSFKNDVFIAVLFELLASVNVLGQIVCSN